MLTASSADPSVTGFKWYKDAALSTLLFSGASFTPALADLDMTVVATTSFYATAVYACGETLASQVDVNVGSSATITPPPAPAQICTSAGIINLTTIVSAVPGGGTFTFSGTGVTASPSFDPTLVVGTTSITANYTSGTCTASTTFNIDVINTASITVPAAAVAICQTSTPVDMTTLVSAIPLGGTFTFTGAGVAGNMFDPSAQSGLVPITVDYNAGGCLDSKTLNFSVTATATLTITNTSVCPASGLLDLMTLVSAMPAGGSFAFAGSSVASNNFDPGTHAGSVVNINVSYVQGGCTAVGTIAVTVRNAGDPLCGVVTNCSLFAVNITDTRPSCSNQNDGIVSFTVSGGTPNYIVTLTDGGSFNQALPGPGPVFSFINLSPANYQYTIQDALGNVCTLPHSLPSQATIQASAANFVDAKCFNQPVGEATITVNSGGSAPYEYSIDGGANWISFTSPVTLNTLIPGPAPYSILVRDDPADVCPAQVMVTIGNAATKSLDTLYVTKTISLPDIATGTLIAGIQESGLEPYQVRLEPRPPTPGSVRDWADASRNTQNLNIEFSLKTLYPGEYQLYIRDGFGCERDYTISLGVDSNIFIPNIFTPNGDGVNDMFFIRNGEGASITITNRWGKEVFKSGNYQNDWGAGSIDDGIYYYRILAGGQTYNGWLEIQRGQ